jgi:hypothetical protein
MSNKEDLQAINGYVVSRSQPAPGAPEQVMSRWRALVSKWKGWYPGVMSSWYVSDSDLANGKAIRDALMRNQNPDAWQWVQETAADKPDRKPYAERPKAPKPTDKPWEAKGLTYGYSYTLKLQKEINAAGYQPPLKIDGDYGPKTKAGHEWLKAKKAGKKVDKTAQKAADQIKVSQGLPASKPKSEPVAPAPDEEVVAPPQMFLGVPVNMKTVLGAAAGAVAGFAGAGPIGAVLGIPAGFLATGEVLKELR